jgi:hypothetical protein
LSQAGRAIPDGRVREQGSALRDVWGKYMHRIRRYSVVAVAAGMLVGGLLVSSGPANAKAAAAPKLKVAPKSKLTNGEEVAVSGTHFTPGDSIFVVECVVGETSTTGSGCNVAGDLGPESVSTKGTWGPVQFKVITGKVGTQGGICGTTKANEKDCAVSAGDAEGNDGAQEVVAFSIPKSSKK